MTFIKQYLKWISTGLVLTGILLTNLNIYPLNIFFHGLGVPLLLGVSRKSIINKIANVENPKDRIHGSISLAICALAQGVQLFRVHDVAETKQAFDLWMAVNFGE